MMNENRFSSGFRVFYRCNAFVVVVVVVVVIFFGFPLNESA